MNIKMIIFYLMMANFLSGSVYEEININDLRSKNSYNYKKLKNISNQVDGNLLHERIDGYYLNIKDKKWNSVYEYLSNKNKKRIDKELFTSTIPKMLDVTESILIDVYYRPSLRSDANPGVQLLYLHIISDTNNPDKKIYRFMIDSWVFENSNWNIVDGLMNYYTIPGSELQFMKQPNEIKRNGNYTGEYN